MEEAMMLGGKVCLVTGGTRGIGRAIALELVKQGARVVVSYRKDSTAAEEALEKTSTLDGELVPLRSNLADPVEAESLIAGVIERFGRLDVLINNAGITVDGAFATMAADDVERVINTNLAGTIRLCMLAAPHLVAGTGCILIVSSLASVVGKEGQVPYAASKGGLNALTRLLARRLGIHGVRVNALAPGFIRTDMVKSLPENSYRHIIRSSALGRMGEPEEVAAVAAFLVGAASSYISGMILRIDGGFHR
jgi:3-oxoacyl-[acyl-carrier protein] reductase